MAELTEQMIVDRLNAALEEAGLGKPHAYASLDRKTNEAVITRLGPLVTTTDIWRAFESVGIKPFCFACWEFARLQNAPIPARDYCDSTTPFDQDCGRCRI